MYLMYWMCGGFAPECGVSSGLELELRFDSWFINYHVEQEISWIGKISTPQITIHLR